jgi:hypothetical protein
VTDAWDDEGFGPEDDWEGTESVEADLEDDTGLDDPEGQDTPLDDEDD